MVFAYFRKNFGEKGNTRVIGSYIDPLVEFGQIIKDSPHDSETRFSNDLKIDNLILKISGDFDGDGIQNWEENLSCTLWNVADSDYGGVNDGEELNVTHGTDPCDSFINFETTINSWDSGNSLL